MRKFLVGWFDGESVILEEITLNDSQKANQETFSVLINEKLNPYGEFYCYPSDVKYWSLIEE